MVRRAARTIDELKAPHRPRSEVTTTRRWVWSRPVPAISPAGLVFYTGDKIKDWKGKAILGGLSSEAVIVVSFDGNKVAGDEIIKMGKRIRDVAQAPDGAMLLLVDGESGGDLLRLAPADEAEAG